MDSSDQETKLKIKVYGERDWDKQTFWGFWVKSASILSKKDTKLLTVFILSLLGGKQAVPPFRRVPCVLFNIPGS